MSERDRWVQVLWVIGERYRELVDPLNGPGGVRGDGESPIQMPATYTPTVREFERLLKAMRGQPGVMWREYLLGVLGWHLLEYHIKAEARVKLEPRTYVKHGKSRPVKDKEGKTVMVPKASYRRHPQASERLARLACEWMAENWGLSSAPELPGEIIVDGKAA